MFVRQRFLDNPRADSRHILHAGVAWVRTCLLPFWGLVASGGRKKRQMKYACRRTLVPDVSSPLLGVGGPRRAEKGANEIFVTMAVNGEFLHFGGF